MKQVQNLLKLFCLIVIFSKVAQAQEKKIKVHSHNDYEHAVPFWEAFSAGCGSIEADVILKDNELYVSHDLKDISAQQTLDLSYLQPLNQLMLSEKINEFDLQILIDCKTDGPQTLEHIIKQIEAYPLLSRQSNIKKKVRFVISGNRPKPENYKNYPDFIQFDHQSLDDLDKIDLSKVALVSFSFRQFSKWNGLGRPVKAEEEKLKAAIEKVHALGKPIRFWASPDTKTAWYRLSQMGEDFINTDHPFACVAYLNALANNINVLDQNRTLYSPTYKSDNLDQKPKNIIFMIGDGNGLAQISAGMYANQNDLNLTKIKNIGLVKTHSADDLVTDSAAGGTAYACGEKTNNRFIGMDANGKSIPNIFEQLQAKNYQTGIITTDNFTGATPSAFYGHVPERDMSKELTSQLLESKIRVIATGGKKNLEGIDLSKTNWELVEKLEELSASNKKQLAYLPSEGGLPSVLNGRKDFLTGSFRQVSGLLKNENKPFFLLLESGFPDGAGHSNNAKMLVEEENAFDEAIGAAIKFVDENPETLLIITADHETGGVTLSHGDRSKNNVELQFDSNDHSGIMVPLFAYGAGSDIFRGVYENTEVNHKLRQLLGLN